MDVMLNLWRTTCFLIYVAGFYFDQVVGEVSERKERSFEWNSVHLIVPEKSRDKSSDLQLGVRKASAYHDEDCILDHDGSNQVLEDCLNKGERFVKEYMRALRRGPHHQFGTCQNFHAFGECMTDLWERCPTVQQVTYKHWKPIVDLLTSACNTTWTRYEWHHDIQCLESEMSGVLVQRCHDLYDFNIEQKTREKCVFLKESIYCKTVLVNSSCGAEVGQVAYSLAKINAKKLIQKSRCYITMEEPYNGFRYSDQCPRDFKDDMNVCYEKHIKTTELEFSEENDLISEGTKKDFRKACGGWHDYRACIRPIRNDCKEGVEKVYEQDGSLRKYLLKMEYLCKEEKQLYKEKLTCLQEVLKNKSLSECNGHWKKLKPWFDEVTSYEYYCEPHNPTTQGTQRCLEDLRLCYELVFSTHCGNFVGGVMSELIRRAFSDPFYLRFDYKADCSLHKKPSSKKRSKPHGHLNRHHGKSGGINHVGGGNANGGQPPDLAGREKLNVYSVEFSDYSGAHHLRQSLTLVLLLCLVGGALQTVLQQVFISS